MAEKDWIRKYFAPLAGSPLAAGLRDDTAELCTGAGRFVITTDAMAEGVHFFADDPVETIAAKLVRVNVSDILSAGARPVQALLTLGWPSQARSEAELARFAAAFGRELRHWNILLAGGDTVGLASGLFVSLTLTGECLGPGPVRRAGGQAGDDLWLTGEVGAARRGYLHRTRGEGDSRWVQALQLPDLPPLTVARLIADHARCAMDVSDGLLGDLQSLADASGLGAEIELDLVPVAGGASGPDEAIDLASWGDDYQLLFSADAGRATLLAASGLRLTRIGRLRAGAGLEVSYAGQRINLPERLAFEHGRIGVPGTPS